MSGFLTFVMGGRDLAAPLDQVREIIRAVGVEPLRGVRAPVTGLIELRGDPLPVVDLRAATDPGAQGDVVVMAPGAEGPVGIAVDRVLAVVERDGFVSDPSPRPIGLPAYVLEVLRSNDAQNRPVLLVDLRILCGLDASAPPANAMS